MLDRRGPWRITFDTNPDDCNLNCLMCERFSKYAPQNPANPRRMDFNLIEEVVEEMVPEGLIEIIPSTMGEPLLYGHFKDMVSLCRNHKIALNLTTNGTWPGSTPAKWAELICPVTRDVKVSWNGASKQTQEEIMIGSMYEKHLKNLRRFVEVRDEIAQAGGNRCSVTLQCTFMEKNLNELPALVSLAASLGVDRVKGHHLWVHFLELDNENLRRDASSRQRWNSIAAKCQKEVMAHRLPNGGFVRLDNFLPLAAESSMFDPSWECPFLGKEAWINTEGRFDPCCAPDAERRKLGYFGVVTEMGFRKLWKSQAYQKLKRKYVSSPVCAKCNMRRPLSYV
jgi:MoaA/NifB/PqqE/SkfB family radical SAM enzyme